MKRHISALIAVAVLAFCSCSSSDSLVQNSLSSDREISLSDDSFDLYPTGETVTLSFTSSGRWTLSSDQSWLNISKNSGKEGTFLITLSADNNSSRADRTATLKFTSSDAGVSKEMKVTQPYPYLRVSILDPSSSNGAQGDSILFKWNDSEEGKYAGKTVSIESNIEWAMEMAEGYGSSNFSISDDSGKDNSKVLLSAKINNIDKSPFVAGLKIFATMPDGTALKTSDGVDEYEYDLYQKNLRFLLNEACDDITVTVDELNKVVTGGSILVDSELPWSVKGTSDWVAMSSESGPADTATVSVLASGVNPACSQREKDIILQSSGGAERIIHVIQKPYIFSLNTKEIGFVNAGGDESSVNLMTTGTWKISDIPSWLNVSPVQGDGSATVTFSCPDQNMNTSDLLQYVHFNSTLNDVSDTLTVSQDKFLFDITPDASLSKIPTFSTNLYDVNVSSSGEWSVSADKSWVKLSAEKGLSSDNIMQVGSDSANPDVDNDRTARLTFVSERHKAKGLNLTKTITITQRRFVFEISVPKTTIAAYTNSKFSLNIDCSASWEITECPSWLTPDAKSGSADQIVNFTVATNTSKSSTRTGKISVKSLYNSATKSTPTLTQDKFVYSVSKTTCYGIAPVNAGTFTIDVTSTDEASWSVSSISDSWVNVTAASGTGNGQVVFAPKDNPYTSDRSASFVILNKVTNESATIKVSQNKYQFSSSALSSYSYKELETASKSFNLTCSGAWTAESSDASWLHVSPASGNGNSSVSFNPDKNVSLNSRTATITVYSTLQKGTANELKSTFTVKQDAYKFDQTSVSETLNCLNDNSLQFFNVDVTCSGAWTVADIPSWLTPSATSGNGDAIVTFTPSTNTEMSARSADFTIVSSDNTSLKKSVSVTQKAYVFSIDKTSESVVAAGGSVAVNISASSTWTAASSQSWISLSAASGAQNSVITLTVAKNTSTAREGTVTFTSAHGHKLTIKISQAGK